MNQALATTVDKRDLLSRLLLEKHRRQFPTLRDKAYFNYGAQGILPEPALQAMIDYYRDLENHAPLSTETGMANLEIFSKTRACLVEELNAEDQTLVLTENVSLGCNIALWGLDWRPGDHVIRTENEYPGVVAAIDALARRFQLKIDVVSVPREPDRLLSELARIIRPETRLLSVSHITWDTGRILPIEAIVSLCRRHGVRVLVDGAQSAGALPLDLDRIGADFYAFTGHKWLCGPEGGGGLFIGRDAMKSLRPTFVGWRGIVMDQAGPRLHADGRRFEIGTSSVALLVGLQKAVELHRQWGSGPERFARARMLAVRFWQGLRTLAAEVRLECLQPDEPDAGLVFFRVPRCDGPSLARYLEAQNLFIRHIPTRDCMRASLHYLNLPEEVDRLITGIRSFCLEVRG